MKASPGMQWINVDSSRTDFLIEKRLSELSPSLHGRVESSIVALTGMLENFWSRFPTFTDHKETGDGSNVI